MEPDSNSGKELERDIDTLYGGVDDEENEDEDEDDDEEDELEDEE